MNLKKGFCAALIATILFVGLAQAVMVDSSNIATRLVGMGSIEAGQFEKAEASSGNTPLEKTWYQRAYMDLGFNASVNDRTKLYFIGECMVHYSYYQTKNIMPNFQPLYQFYPHHVEGTYSLGNIEKPYLKMGVGIFPFKYNPEVRNLGEYLYRTGTYPPTMKSEFDFPLNRLTGFKLNSTLFDTLNLCAMLTSESDMIPLEDWGVSVLGDYTIFKSITVGAGVFFSHLFAVDENTTTPKTHNLAPITSSNSDTIYYTYRGTKIMGRISFDPKPFIPLTIFGENDLRIYSETAILGLKNYPQYYSELWRRIPFMVGFNIPAFKVLDVFSVELEWYKWNFANSYTQYVFQDQTPHPDDTAGVDYDYKQNILKWSFYAKKNLTKNFSFIGQVAYDHLRLESNSFQQSAAYFGDAMHKHGDWAWIIKSEFSF